LIRAPRRSGFEYSVLIKLFNLPYFKECPDIFRKITLKEKMSWLSVRPSGSTEFD
jgi:hypothetical protein